MNADAEKAALGDDHSFHVKKGHQYLDIRVEKDAGPGAAAITEADLEEFEVGPWLKTGKTVSPNKLLFRLFICAPREPGCELILPMLSSTYEELASAWGFPPLVLCTVRQPYAVTTFFNPSLETGDLSNRGTGFVMRFDSHWECESFIVVIKTPIGETNVFVAGLNSLQIPRFKQSIKNSAHLLSNPLLVPVLMLSELCQNQTDWLGLISPDMDDIQRRLGMSNWKYSTDSPFYGHDAVDNLIGLDLAGITIRLNRMSDSIRFQDQVALTLIETLEALDEKQREIAQTLGAVDEQRKVDEAVGQTITVLLKSLKGCQRRVSYRKGTIEGLLATVYTLIAQRDNYLSLDVAFHTRKDSTDMRIIAAVTLCFLPGMFTATLFSTTFFDFQATESSAVLSPYHWIYWATTFAATAAVLVFWLMYTTREKKHKLPDILGSAEPRERITAQSYNTTDIPEEIRRKNRFAGW